MFKGLRNLLAGVIAGTAIGILFAPNKGKDLRQKVSEELKSGGSGLKATGEALSEMSKDLGETSQHIYDEVSKTEAYKQAEAKLKEHANDARQHASKLYKDNLSPQARRNIKKGLSTAKKAVSKISKKLFNGEGED